MKNFAKILGIILLIAGSVLCVFSTIPVVDYIGIGVSALGLAVLIVTTYKKAEKKTWKEIVAIILFAVGGFCCGIAGFTEQTVTQLATAIVGVVSLVMGLITVFIPKK